MIELLTSFFLSQGVQICLFSIMVCLGVSISVDDLLQAIAHPKALISGLTAQIIFLPLLGFFIVMVFRPDPVIGIGLVLLAACPGGVTSNGYVLISRGDVALSVALTVISSLVIVLTMPLLTALAFRYLGDQSISFEVPIGSMMISLVKLTVLPITLGLLLRAKQPEFADKILEPARKFAFVLLMIVIVGNTLASLEVLLDNLVEIGLLALTLNLSALAMGNGIARALRLSAAGQISITFEVGIQNLSLVLTLALAILHMPEYATFALVYALFMKVTALILVAIWQGKTQEATLS